MRYLIIFALLILNTIQVFSQQNFEYDRVLSKFKVLDTSLTKADILSLYFQSAVNRDIEQIVVSEIRIKNLTSSGEFAKAVFVADSLLEKYPVSLVALFEKSYACATLGRTEEERVANKQYNALMRSVIFGLDGKKPETAFVLINQNDEYEVLRYLGFHAVSYREISLAGKTYDVIALKKNKHKISEIFFDISIPAKLKDDKLVDELRKSK